MCAHCYATAQSTSFPGELSNKEARRMLEDLAAFGVPVVLLSGGEPLARPDILPLAAHARELGIRVTISTNGTLITPEVAQSIAAIGVSYVGISLDGMEQTHDRFRGQSGAYQAALQGLRNSRAAGIKTGLRLTLTRHTAGDLDTLFDLVDAEGIGRVCFYHLVPTGRGRFLRDDMLSPEATRTEVERIFRRAADYVDRGKPVEILTVDNHADAALLYLWAQRERGAAEADRIWEEASRSGGNRSGIAISHIDFRGQVHPDQFMWQTSLGNVRTKSFSKIWSDSTNPVLTGFRNRRPLLKGRCSSCRFLDLCNGNVRARAEALTGDLWAADPACYLTDDEISARQGTRTMVEVDSHGWSSDTPALLRG
jgi:radical SAM protein with 4Fe4S-binding SPASM domain